MNDEQCDQVYQLLVQTLVELDQIWIVYEATAQEVDEGPQMEDEMSQPARQHDFVHLPFSQANGSGDDHGGTIDQIAVLSTAKERLLRLLDVVEQATVTTAELGGAAFDFFHNPDAGRFVNAITFQSVRDPQDRFTLDQPTVTRRRQAAADLRQSLLELRRAIGGE